MSETDPIIGKKLGDYIIVDVLGQGGMARVYRGMDKKLNRYAAVKVIDAHLIREDQEEYRQRFQNEARAIARLSHPNIVGIYQFDQIGTIYYMAMSFIEGKDLRAILKNHVKNGTRMSYAEILQVIRDIGGALDYAHSEGVIHRDIKPSNIMVTGSNKSILMDFGLALSVPEGTIGNTFGSAHYIAPEQAVSSAQAVPQSDIYALGVVLFEMLTNRVPFNDPSAMAVAMKHLNDPPPPPSRINPNLPPKVDQVVLRALDKDPKKRFPNAAVMAQSLEAAFSQIREQLETDSQIKPLPSWDDPPDAFSRPSRPSAPSAPRDSDAARLLASWDDPAKTPTPRPAPPIVDDAPTLTDSQGSAALRAQIMKEVPLPSRRRFWLLSSVALLALIGLFAVVAVITNLNRTPDITATNTPTAEETQAVAVLPSTTQAVSAAITETPSPSETSRVVESTTDEPTATEANVSVTSTVRATAPTDTAAQLPSPSPESSPTLEAVSTAGTGGGSAGAILLRYDAQSLTLLNQSDQEQDVSGLKFVQIDGDGQRLDFESARWSGGSRPITNLPSGDCFQVMLDTIPRLDKSAYCGRRHAWSRTSFLHWFWLSDNLEATFEVRRGDEVLATCAIAAGECSFDLPG